MSDEHFNQLCRDQEIFDGVAFDECCDDDHEEWEE